MLNPECSDINITNSPQTLFILDYSNSMNEMLIDKTKYSMLIASMKTILSNMSPSQKIGIRVYGHRWGFTPYDACRASALIVPIGSGNFNAISESLAKLSPRGMTPITYSLKQAVKNDFNNTVKDKHIILITDGGENCDESPCTYAMELVKYRKDIRIDVIAFNLDSEEDLDQLRCVAKVTKGELYNANTHAELVRSLDYAFSSKKHVDAKIIH
ncbi:MAG: VWA domain-containing protein [Candidatus Gastranaerophilales bacterium]|nr:VWA domain-containing protein [Candidatus Gastranaerophilales bacterium]